MRQQSIVYEKASGEVNDYDIEIISVDDRYIEAVHDGMEKTFRRDRVIHVVDADDDIEEVIDDWQVMYEEDDAGDDEDDDSLMIDLDDLDLAENTRGATNAGGFSRLAEAEQRAQTKAKPAPQAAKTDATEASQPKKKRIHWGSFWLGFAVAWGIMITIGVTAQP